MRLITAPRIFDGYRFHENRVLVLADDGMVIDLVEKGEAAEVEEFGGLIMPGMINCHCHLELSHMRGVVPEGTGLVDFVFHIVTGRHFPEEEIREAIRSGEEEMHRNGIVAVGDICNNALTIEQKHQGNLAYYNFIESSGWLPTVAEARFERAKGLLDVFSQLPTKGPRTTDDRPQKKEDRRWSVVGGPWSAIVPHAPYSVSEPLWKLIQPGFAGKTVSIHNQETRFEDEFFLHGTGDFSRMYELMNLDNGHHRPSGKTSLQTYFHRLAGAERALLVHNTFTTAADIDLVKSSSLETYFCLCVNANQYIERSLPPVELLRSKGSSIVLGTDSLASNWSLSIWDEIRTLQTHFSFIPLEELLQWATINGAKALGLDAEFGSFEKGKRPGIVQIDEQGPQRIL